MKFLVLDGALLRNTSFTPADKLIISYIYGLEKAGREFYGSLPWLSMELGIALDYLEKRITRLVEFGIIVIFGNKYRLNLAFDDICEYKFTGSQAQINKKPSNFGAQDPQYMY